MKSSNDKSYDELGKLYQSLKEKYEIQKDKLQRLENELKKVQKITRIGTWYLDLATNEVEWTEELYKMYGFDPLLPVPPYTEHMKLFTKESWDLLSKSLDNTAKTGIPYELELNTIRKDKSKGWMWVRGEVIRNSKNETIGLWGAAQDITWQKEIQEDLIQSERLLNEMGNMAKVGGWQLDLDTNKLTWTNEVYSIHEVENDFIPTVKDAINFYDEPSQKIITELLNESIKKGNKFDTTLKIISAKGNKIDVRAIGKVIKDGNGRPQTIFGSFQDITLSKKNEIKLIESQERYKNLFDNLVDEVHYWKVIRDKNGRIENWKLVDANPQALKSWNKSRENVVGKTTNEIFKQDARKLFMPIIEKVFETGEPMRWEEYFPPTKQYLSMDTIPIGEYFISTGRDITKTKKTQQELSDAKEKAEANEAKFKFLNRLTSDMLALNNIESYYKYISENLQKYNPECIALIVSINEYDRNTKLEAISGLENTLLKKISQIAGYNPLGKIYKLTDFHKSYFKTGNIVEYKGGLAEFSSSEFPAVAAKAIEKLVGIHKIFSIGINKDNELLAAVHFFVRKKQVVIDKNFIEVFVKQAGLVLQKKIYENALEAAKEKAEESDRLKSAFLANMSHEIRTPMNGILGFTELLQNANLSSENQSEYINIIKKSGDRLLNTVNDIIEISKIESGEVTVIKKELDIIKHLENLVSFFISEASKKPVELFIEHELPKKRISTFTDETKLTSIISNLIKNAIKYTEKGYVKVGYKLQGKKLLFTCKDTGIGIPVKRLAAIFNRFEQADIEDKRALEGSGLGLAIANSYAEMMNGKIWVESEEGKGSTFFVELVYEPVSEKKAVSQQSSNNFEISEKKNIKALIVEDDEISSAHLIAITKNIFNPTIIATNGLEAVNVMLKDKDIQLILMDVKMPKMDGYEATRKIREFNKNVVIIAQTAYAFEEDKKKALAAGCNDYISKPIRKEKLLSLINKYY